MDKLDHLGWVASSSYAIGGARFAVRSTSHAFGGWLSDTLGEYEVEDVEEFLYSVVVPELPADGRTKEFLILYKGSSAIVRTLDPATLARSLLAELGGHGLHERHDAVYLMAAVAQVHDEPVMIPASLAPGLAKLGRRSTKLGVEVPGEFAIGVDLESARVIPIPQMLDLRGDPLEALRNAFSWEGRDGLRFVSEPTDVSAILVPAKATDASAQLTRRGYALANLTGWALNLEQTGGRGLEALGRFVERTPCYGSTWTDAADAITQLAEAIEGNRERGRGPGGSSARGDVCRGHRRCLRPGATTRRDSGRAGRRSGPVG